MDIIKMLTLVFGATGIWRLVEVLIKHKIEKKKVSAETNNIYTQANTTILGNWEQWSNKLEARVKDLERQNEQQRICINDLETLVKKLKEYNTELMNKLEEYTNK